MKRYIRSNTNNWPTESYWEEVDLSEDEEVWDKYLCDPETEVDDNLQIFQEPSVQGGMGSMFIYDESDEDRFEPIEIDFSDWCNEEITMAIDSKNAQEYKAKYKAYIKKLCGI